MSKHESGYHFMRNINEANEKFIHDTEKFDFDDNERNYLNRVFEYVYSNVGSPGVILVPHKHDNRLYNVPHLYKRNTYIMESKSPQERINNFENLLSTDKSKISRIDFYFYYNSLLNENDKNNNISKVIRICEEESDYEYNLSHAIKGIIPPTDSRIGVNLEYIWHCFNSNGLYDESIYQKIKRKFSEQKFLDLNNANKANLLERESFTEQRIYFDYIKEDDYSAIIEELIKYARPYNYFEIFGLTEKIASKSQMEKLIIQYRNHLQTIKEKYNYYAENPSKGKRKDENDKDLWAYNKYLKNVDNLYDINISKYRFSFED